MLKKISLVSFLALSTACGSVVDTSSLASLPSSASGESIFLDDANFEADFQNKVLPLIASAKTGTFEGAKGAKLFHMAIENPNAKGRIVIVNGFTENTIKTRELAYNFYQAGYSVYTYDHRGQGASTRFSTDRGIGHVDAWENYLADLNTFLTKVVPASTQKTFIFAHSMGGAIVADALTANSKLAHAVVLSSPALALKAAAGKGGELLIPAQALAATMVTVGQGKKYGLTQEALNNDTWTVESSSTSSPERFQRYKTDVLAADQAMGGASWGWQNEALKMNVKFSTDFTFAKAGKTSIVSKVTTPILMGQAGLDSLAFNPAQDDYCARAQACNVGLPLNSLGKKPVLFENSKHELYNEKSEIRNKWLEQILSFYGKNLK